MTLALEGKRLRPIHTDDQYIELHIGDVGTITDLSELPASMGGERQIWAKWDSGSSLAMIEGHDVYDLLEEERIGDP